MSGAIGLFAVKAITGALIGKVVGKVTGNEKLGMIAALAAGTLIDPATLTGEVLTNAAGTDTLVTEGLLSKAGTMLSGAAGTIQENPMVALIGAQTVMGAVGGYEAKKEAERGRAEARRVALLDEKRAEETQLRNIAAETATYTRRRGGFAPTPISPGAPSITEPTPSLLAGPAPAAAAPARPAPIAPSPIAPVPSPIAPVPSPIAPAPVGPLAAPAAQQYFDQYRSMYGRQEVR